MMEPVAPGTEDELVDYNSLTKQEEERDRLLNLKVRLRNGQVQNVFELTYVNSAEHWFCKVCECPIMGRVYQHELGRRHSQNWQALENRGRNKDERFDEGPPGVDPIEEAATQMEIAPGEPVPPGFENEIREAQIQERLDGFKVGPLVALEYLLEMQDYDASKEPSYLCILCDKKGDPRTVLTHLASYNHISQYLQKHFPSCYRALAPYTTKQYKRNWQAALQKIAEAIEKKFGRLRPFCIEQDKFEKDRMHYLTKVIKGKHFCEQNGPNFVELVVHDELTKTFDDDGRPVKPSTATFGNKAFIEREAVIQQQTPKRSPSPPVVARPTKKTRPSEQPNKPPPNKPPLVRPPPNKPPTNVTANSSKKPPPSGPKGRRRSLSSLSSLSDEEPTSGNRRMARNRSPPNRNGGRRPQNDRFDRDSRDSRGFRRRSPSPARKRPVKDDEEERRKTREKDRLQKLEEYTKLCKAIENDVEKTTKQYEKNPERHPKYNEEWKQFWNKRYKELQGEGKDASKYDFKPEWITYWGKRMRELSQDELKERKDGLRKRLGLGEEPTPISFRIGGCAVTLKSAQPKAKESRPTLPMAARPDPEEDPEIIVLDEKDDDVRVTKKPPPMNRFQDPNISSSRDSRDKARSHSPWEIESSPPRIQPRGGRDDKKRSPIPMRRERSLEKRRSRERSFERKRSPERRRSTERSRRSPERSRRSPDRSRRSPRRSPERSRRSPERQRRSPERQRRSPERRRRTPERPDRQKRTLDFKSPERRSHSIEIQLRRSVDRDSLGHRMRSRSPERSFIRERDLRDREMDMGRIKERSRERGMRESSFERDIRARDRIRTVADLPWEREKMMYGHPQRMMEDYYAPPPMMRDVSRQPQQFQSSIQDEELDAEEVNIVSVLRLLTALEERLGSLGPKIIDLLAQALALEKKEANSSETLLDNEINCVMFETIKEKLKGQLLAGLVEFHQERAFKRAIQKTANLIHLAGERKKKTAKPISADVAVPGVGAVDKAAIAKQLANALIAQGKTNVTQGELEQLVNAVVGMAEATKNSSKPVTASSFLAQLAGEEPPKEKIIIPRVKSSEEKPKPKDSIIDLDGLTEPLSPSTPERATSNMENLSDSDLQTLLQNFKDLSTEEQMNLINYLKKLEFDEPERVERLRKFVNLGTGDKSKEIIDLDKETSPSGNRNRNEEEIDSDFNKRRMDDRVEKMRFDSEDEDYSFEDVVKAASKNIKQKELEDNRKIVEDSIGYSQAQKGANLTDAKTIISNLMNSFSQSNNQTSSTAASVVNLLGLPMSSSSTTLASMSQTVTTPTSSENFAKTLSSISMDSLTSIVSNVQKGQDHNRLNFVLPEPTMSVERNIQEPRLSNPPAPTGLHFDLAPQNPHLDNLDPMMNQRNHMVPPPNHNHNMGQRPPFLHGPNQHQFGNDNFRNQRPQRPPPPVRSQFNSNFNNSNPRFGPRGPAPFKRW